MSANNSVSYIYKPGPLTRAYSQAKREIIATLDRQEANVVVNRSQLAFQIPLPNKLLAVRRSKKNLLLEVSPLTAKYQLGKFGKKAQPEKPKNG